MNKKACLNADWQELGRKDGTDGRPLVHGDKRERACRRYDIVIDRPSYDRGRAQGLKEFCTVPHFYYLGEVGSLSHDVSLCPAESHDNLLISFRHGVDLYLLRLRRNSIEKEIDDYYKNADKDRSVLSDVTKVINGLAGVDPMADRKRDLAQVESEIKSVEARSPDASEYCDHEMKQKRAIKRSVPNFMLGFSPALQADLETCSRPVPDTSDD